MKIVQNTRNEPKSGWPAEFGMHTYREELKRALYSLNRFLDFQEWLTEVYLDGSVTGSELWEQFEKWEDEQQNQTKQHEKQH